MPPIDPSEIKGHRDDLSVNPGVVNPEGWAPATGGRPPVLRPKPMTLAEACAVLNEFRHGHHSEWFVVGAGTTGFIRGKDRHEGFCWFEGVAVAEKYLREREMGVDFTAPTFRPKGTPGLTSEAIDSVLYGMVKPIVPTE